MRTLLLRLGEHEHILVLTLHHIICDGWSLGVLVHELGVLYGAFSAGRPSPLPEPPIQYADYAHWQRDRLRGPVLDELLDYWKARLEAGAERLDLPTDRPRPRGHATSGARLSLTLPPALATRSRPSL